MEYVTKSCPHLCIIKKPRAHFEHGVFLFEHARFKFEHGVLLY